MSILKAGICCEYCMSSRGGGKKDFKLSCIDALKEARDEAVEKYDLGIIHNKELSEFFELVQSMEFSCFSCKGDGAVLSIVNGISNIEIKENKRIKEKIGNMLVVNFVKRK